MSLTTQMMLIIPLLDESLIKEDISEATGFVGAYMYDINRPSLQDCIFLMYRTDTTGPASCNTAHKLRHLKTIRSIKRTKIKDVLYTIYAFPIINNDVKRFKKGLSCGTTKSVNRILQFWGVDCPSTVSNVLFWGWLPYEMSVDTIPEEDYQPNLDEIYFGDAYYDMLE